MARVDRRRAQREARNARAAGRRGSGRSGSGRGRGTSARAVENQLFFIRLRTKAKWAFALMVVVFVVGFAFLGVGSGGLDLQSLVQDVFGSKGGSGAPSLAKALSEVQKHPRQANAYRQLADAYERKGQHDQAVGALEQYVTLAPKDLTQLRRLGSLELTAATNAQQAYQAAYVRQQSDNPSSSLGATQQDPITQAISARDSQAVQQTLAAYQAASTQAVRTFKRLARVQRTEPNLVLLANVAVQLGDVRTAVTALKGALAVKGVDTATRRQIKARLAQLQPAAKKSRG